MAKIYIDEGKSLQPLPSIESGYVVGLDEQQNTQFAVIGKVSLDEQIDNTMTALHYFLSTFNNATNGEHKQVIYDRAVMAFSLMIDHFYPEGKDIRNNGVTAEAIKRAEDEILKESVNANISKG